MISANANCSGFWATIRDEFASRHIACEFKNSAKPASKSDLNQLRIYLSKRTVGRFGLLFVRLPASPSLQRAQREAYEQSQILVLIIDDKLAERLLWGRAFLGDIADVLEREKIAFEVKF